MINLDALATPTLLLDEKKPVSILPSWLEKPASKESGSGLILRPTNQPP